MILINYISNISVPATILLIIVYGLIVNNMGADLSYFKLAILGLVLSIVSQIGDLVASTIKRQNDLKD